MSSGMVSSSPSNPFPSSDDPWSLDESSPLTKPLPSSEEPPSVDKDSRPNPLPLMEDTFVEESSPPNSLPTNEDMLPPDEFSHNDSESDGEVSEVEAVSLGSPSSTPYYTPSPAVSHDALVEDSDISVPAVPAVMSSPPSESASERDVFLDNSHSAEIAPGPTLSSEVEIPIRLLTARKSYHKLSFSGDPEHLRPTSTQSYPPLSAQPSSGSSTALMDRTESGLEDAPVPSSTPTSPGRLAGTEIQGSKSVSIPFLKSRNIPIPYGPLLSTWLLLGLSLVCVTLISVFASLSTRTALTGAVVLPPDRAITIITAGSSFTASLIGMVLNASLNALRWRLAVRGVHFSTFVGLAPATGKFGLLALLRSRRFSWVTRSWVTIVLLLAGIQYALSFILTIGLQPVTDFWDNSWNWYAMTGMGPFCPYDLSGILFAGPSLSNKIALNYNGFTADITQLLPVTTNFTQPGLGPQELATIRPICSSGCYAYLMPGGIDQVVIDHGPWPWNEAPITTLCNASHPEACVIEPFVYDQWDFPTLLRCDPADTQCVTEAILSDRKSLSRSRFSGGSTDLTSWPGYNISDVFRIQGPAYMLYFDPVSLFQAPGAQNMSECGLFIGLGGYAIYACIKELSDASFAIGWSVCEPIARGCQYTEPGWRSPLNSSTILSIETRWAHVAHSLPAGEIQIVEGLSAAQPLTINSTQFFNLFTSAWNNTDALISLVYNTAAHPDLSPYGADVRMRDLLTYAFFAATSSILIETDPPDHNASWSNVGYGGMASSRNRILIDDGWFAVFVSLSAICVVFSAILLVYSATAVTPNQTDFPELDIAARFMDRSLFEGQSNACTSDVAERLHDAVIFVQESPDGKSVAITTTRGLRNSRLQMKKAYV